MVCLEGGGAISHVSLRHGPGIYNEPLIFASVVVPDIPNSARVLEGPVPSWKVQFPWGRDAAGSSGNGAAGKHYGLPRLDEAVFSAEFPFGTVELLEEGFPLRVRVH